MSQESVNYQISKSYCAFISSIVLTSQIFVLIDPIRAHPLGFDKITDFLQLYGLISCIETITIAKQSVSSDDQ